MAKHNVEGLTQLQQELVEGGLKPEDVKKLDQTQQELLKAGFDIEKAELVSKSSVQTDYPKPVRAYRLHYEAYNTAIEEPYFWVLHYLRYFGGFTKVDKITDIFSAAENSSFFGVNQQRLGAQQEKVSQYLATVGKMVRELFQLVRELRILDERISYYADSYTDSKSAESADITLKGIWVDMVEQGAKNPASVYGMAREVQFTTLPDLFFSTHPKRQEDVDTVVERERGNFNRKVREVLKRKLRAYLAWKEHSYEEIKNRRIFTLKYLRQHYDIINMYVSWVKPYLKNIRRLQLHQQKNDSPDLIVAFESSMIEIELLAYKSGSGDYKQCLLMHFLYRTRPDMNYQQEYQRGPIHIGRVEMTFRSYAWTDEDIEAYKRVRKDEDFRLLSVVDGSVEAALNSLGDELQRYLKEAGEDIAPAKKEGGKKKKGDTAATALFKGFGELFGSLAPSKKEEKAKKRGKAELYKAVSDRKKAGSDCSKLMWDIYHHYKKHHGMLNW